MTLDTRVLLTGPITGEQAFDLSLRAILAAAQRDGEVESAVVDRQAAGAVPDWAADSKNPALFVNDYDQISTKIGQGLPAITEVRYRADGSPLAAEDVYSDEYGDEPYLSQHACTVEVSWDTAYGYSHNGIGCGELHALAIVHLFRSLPDGVMLRWINEFDGKIHEGVVGLGELATNASQARAWFLNVALPVIEAEAAAS